MRMREMGCEFIGFRHIYELDISHGKQKTTRPMKKTRHNSVDQTRKEPILTFVHGNQTLDDLLLLLLALTLLDLLLRCGRDLLLALH